MPRSKSQAHVEALQYNDRLRIRRKKVLAMYTRITEIPEDYLEQSCSGELRHDSGKIIDSQGNIIAMI